MSDNASTTMNCSSSSGAAMYPAGARTCSSAASQEDAVNEALVMFDPVAAELEEIVERDRENRTDRPYIQKRLPTNPLPALQDGMPPEVVARGRAAMQGWRPGGAVPNAGLAPQADGSNPGQGGADPRSTQQELPSTTGLPTRYGPAARGPSPQTSRPHACAPANRVAHRQPSV